MYRLLIIVVILSFCLLAKSQREYRTESKKAIKYYEEGLRYYNQNNYSIAVSFLTDAIKADENFQNAYLVLAEVYWESGNYELAVKYYEEGLKIDPFFYSKGYYNKARLEIKIARYTDALASFKQYLKLEPDDEKYKGLAERGIKQAQFAIHAVENPVDFVPLNLGPNINSVKNEYWPSLSADGNMLVITRQVDSYSITSNKNVQEDFYFSLRGAEGWGPVKNVGYPLNTPDNEGAQSISANGQLMVYTVCNRKGVIGRCDLFYSEHKGDEWTIPKNIGGSINSTAKETQPSLSADGRTIYFSSDRPGGKGGLDIWMSSMDDNDKWKNPVNLGDTINTPGDEQSPFIHHDNNTLYFASDYHPGMGGFDLFISRKDTSEKWMIPENIGYPINTNLDEMGLIVNAKGNIAYYSGRNDGNGLDIYQFELPAEVRPQEVSYMKGRVFDDDTRERLYAEFELYDLKDGSLIGKSYSDERTGEFLLCIPTNNNYMLNVSKKGYLFYSDHFSLQGVFHLEKPFLKDVPLKRIESGKTMVLKNIFYKTDSYALRSESKYELDKVIKFLNANPSILVEISGYTDNVGTEVYNQELSENRARSVVEYLTGEGIDKSRLTFKGYGLTSPVDTNDTPEGRANNRRTELKILN
ncbi:MAG: PD40 domain-containing protein [Bacteroidales bacterium]|nr:PD40 domain-containing protein [Bacteroidales bacterium]